MTNALDAQIPVTIAGTGSYVPDRILTNDDLSRIVDTTDEWIIQRTGISERRIAADDEFSSTMATKAARVALKDAGITAEEVDLIIVATITPDTLTPSTACHVQHNLGAVNAVAFDISAACSGYLYAMNLATNLIRSGAYRNVLIIAAEKLSAFVNWQDRGTCVLFGDGAGAAVLRPAQPGETRILASNIGADGSQTHLLAIRGGGSACPIRPENADQALNTLSMAGREVFKIAVTRMKEAATKVIEQAGLTPEDINLIIPHQANRRIIDAIAERLDIPADRVFINLHKYGNTSAASLAIALDEARKTDVITADSRTVLVAFGAGLTWAAVAIEWGTNA